MPRLGSCSCSWPMSSTLARNRAKSSIASGVLGVPLLVVHEVVAHVVEGDLLFAPLLAERIHASSHPGSLRRFDGSSSTVPRPPPRKRHVPRRAGGEPVTKDWWKRCEP